MPVLLRWLEKTQPVQCPCGESRRLITREDTQTANLHVTSIRQARMHLHKRCTEFYYILEGSGRMQVGEESFDLRPGAAFMVEPGTPHRGEGRFEALIVGVPAFDPEDEYIVE